MSLMVVVLPAPFGPRKPVTLPGTTSNDRLLTAIFSPYRLLSPRTSIMRMSPLWRHVGKCPRDHHGHVAITVLARVPRRQDDQPGAVLRLVFDLDSYRTVRVEAHPFPPAPRRGGQDPQVASQRTERGPGAW